MECKKCILHTIRKNIVNPSGAGKIVLLFEIPHYYEDKLNVTLYGNNRELLLDVLGDCGLFLDDFYVTYLVKCRAPNNRNALKQEIDTCKEHLENELNEINPKIIITFGKNVTKVFTNKSYISVINKPFIFQNCIILPTINFKAVIANKENKKILIETFKIIKHGLRT